MVPLGNESMFASRVLDSNHFSISAWVRVVAPTSPVSVNSLALLETIVSLEVEIDRPIMVQGARVSQQLRVCVLGIGVGKMMIFVWCWRFVG